MAAGKLRSITGRGAFEAVLAHEILATIKELLDDPSCVFGGGHVWFASASEASCFVHEQRRLATLLACWTAALLAAPV